MDILKFLFYIFIFPGGLFSILISTIIFGIDRKLVARMQRRIGPPITQTFYDILKLFGKEVIIPKESNKKIFILAPIIGLISILLIPPIIPMFNNIFLSFNSDIILIIYLLTISAIVLIVCGINSKSSYGAIGASREGVLLLSLEFPMVISILSVCIYSAKISNESLSFSLQSIVNNQTIYNNFLFSPILIPAAIAFLMVIPGEAGVIPFDIAESETEICEGPLVEYSGKYLAILKIMQMVKGVVIVSLFVSLFLGGVIKEKGIFGILIFILIMFLIIFLTITLVRTTFGRMKINQALKFYWTFPTLVALISLILVTLI